MNYPTIADAERIKKLNISPERISLVIDSDTKNEVDDQFAIVWALLSKERFDVKAVYAAPFHHACFEQFKPGFDRTLLDNCSNMNGKSVSPEDGMEQSYQESLKILKLLQEPTEKRVFRGSSEYIHDIRCPIISDAAADLVQRARTSEKTIYVAAIGALTNIASAILLDPEIIRKIVIIWLGGHELSYGHGIEFNLIQDVKAAQVIFESGVPLIWIPCNNVASSLSISEEEIRNNIMPAGEIGHYLAEAVLDTFHDSKSKISFMKYLRYSTLRNNTDQEESYLSQFKTEHIAWSRIIWDIAAIAILKNPNWIPSKMIKAPVICDDYSWKDPDRERHMIRVATFCHRDMIFGDLIHCLWEAFC